MFSQKINARIDMIDKTKLLAIVLMGSYARGEAGKFSDIDIVCFSKENVERETPLIEIVDGKYLVVSTVTTEEAESWFSEPEKAIECVNGLRSAVPIWDPTGYVAELQARALRFVWDESLQHKANLYAGKSLLWWGEEVHKALQGVITGDIGRMLNGLHGLTFGIFKVVRVQRGILLPGENYFFNEVINHFGHQSEFARLSKIAFGIDEAVTLRERVLAGLELFCLVVDMLADDMSGEVKDDVLFIADEVREELKRIDSGDSTPEKR